MKMLRHHGTVSSVPNNVQLKEPKVSLTDLKESHGQLYNLYTTAQRRNSLEGDPAQRRSASATNLRPESVGMAGVVVGVEGVREKDKSRERGVEGSREKEKRRHHSKHGHSSSRHRGTSSSEGESTSSSPAPIKLKLQLVPPKDEAGHSSSPLRLKIKRMPEQGSSSHAAPVPQPEQGLKMKLQLPGSSAGHHSGHHR
jgi:hypothetical protein